MVSSEVKSYASARSSGGKSEEVSTAEASVSQMLKEFDLTAAVNIVERWRDGDTAYAFAMLDKQKALGSRASSPTKSGPPRPWWPRETRRPRALPATRSAPMRAPAAKQTRRWRACSCSARSGARPISAEELRAKAGEEADLIVVGTATARSSGKFGATTVWCTATAAVRVVEVATGQKVKELGDAVKGKLPGELNTAGREALEALADKLAPEVAQAVAAAARCWAAAPSSALDLYPSRCYIPRPLRADIAQLAEQLIRNQQVIGSNPIVGSSCSDPSSTCCRACWLMGGRTASLMPIRRAALPPRSSAMAIAVPAGDATAPLMA